MNVRRKWRRAAVSVAVVATLAGLAACAGSDSPDPGASGGGEEAGDFQIYALGPLSGPLAGPGAVMKAGLEGAVKVINENGGILGRNVVLTLEDNAGEPTQVAGKIQQALQSETPPDLVHVGFTSTEALAGLPLTNQANVLATTVAASEDFVQFDRFLSATPLGKDSAAATLSYVADSGAKTAALIVADNVAGESAVDDYESQAEDLGITITGVERVAPDAIDASPQLQRLQGGDPDALIVSMFGPVVGPVLESRTQLGWEVPVFGDQYVSAFPYASLVSEADLENVEIVPVAFMVEGSEAASQEAVATAIEAIVEANGGPLESPIAGAVHAYMSLILAKYAFEAAGTTDAAAAWEARLELSPDSTPLYGGASELYSREDAWAWPFWQPQDFELVSSSTGFVDGFIVPD